MMRDRIASQIQADQLDLFRLQNQISTGLRIFLPSDDASSAQRAIVLQQTLERKDQSATNLEGALSALSSAETSLGQIGNKLNELKAEAIGVVGTISTQKERDAVINILNETLSVLTAAGNATYTDSYLFSGGEASREPYVSNNGYIEYQGNESNSRTFVDIGILFDVSIPGDEIFGGLSEAVRGTRDLDLQLDRGTKLSQINGGLGVSPNGSLALTFDPTALGDPSTSSVVDISSARTVEDLIRTIESGAPEGAEVRVEVSDSSLTVTTLNGDLTIGEVAEGRTAKELGLLSPSIGQPVITGTDLAPRLLTTSLLSDLDGTKAQGILTQLGDNNDLLIRAASNGSALNNATIEVLDGTALGSEIASYNAATNTLTVTIAAGESTANHVRDAIHAEGTFTAQTDIRDTTSLDSQGSGEFFVGTYAGATDNGGSGGSLDLASGLRVTNGDTEHVLDTSSAETVQDLLNLFNQSDLGFQATINASGEGIDVRSRRSGVDFTIGENGGSTATDLGIRTFTGLSKLDDFNRGVGVAVEEGENSLVITTDDAGIQTTYTIDTDGLVTVDALIAEISSATGGNVTATLAAIGNGLTLTGTTPADPGSIANGAVALAGDTLSFTSLTVGDTHNRNFTIEVVDGGSGGLATTVVGDTITVDLGGSGVSGTDAIAADIATQLTDFSVTSNSSTVVAAPIAVQLFSTTGGGDADPAGVDAITLSGGAAERLGFLADGATSATSATGAITSTDRNPSEVDSVFTTLLRLRDALEQGNVAQIGHEVTRLDDDLDRLTLGRAEIGSRVQNLSSVRNRLADEEVDLRAALSREMDTDFVQAVSDYTSKQASLQASLQTASTILSLSILDYI